MTTSTTRTEAHTPGPWLVMNGHRKGACDIIHQRPDDRTDHICALDPYIGNQANARLIASAPDLLAALIEAWNAMDCEKYLQNGRGESVHSKIGIAMNSAQKAIAKATHAEMGWPNKETTDDYPPEPMSG